MLGAAEGIPTKQMIREVPDGVELNGCEDEFDAKEAEKSGRFSKDDPLQEHYKKTGWMGGLTGMFGDKKTMWCHHMTSAGEPAVRSAKSAGKSFKTVEEVWQFLDKKPCCGRYAYDRKKGSLICGPCIKADHDKTCNRDTCLFIASGLECPVPTDAFKE
ncbi:unnamed protein product [Prorocentrum cordatum]|uniref:Uncharacterized protein n=1 Tax=Prorocentrum cordatum TaxID=2364126 RepID=A0ABN9UZ86_9DINO|nr:unnamed protein product [Polarella glacialis]